MRNLFIALCFVCCFAPLALAAEVDIDQAGQKFDPDTVSVKVGDTVKFHNSDDVTHNIQITDSSGNNEDQGLQKPGEDITKSIDKSGTFTVQCSIHPRMKMTIEAQ